MRMALDTSSVEFRVSRVAEPKTERDSDRQRIDRRTGDPLWMFETVAEDDEGAEVIRVTVASHQQPKLTKGQPVQIEGLEAIPWSQGERSGVAYRAKSVTQPSSVKPAASAA